MKYSLFVDLDGVLVDFDRGVQAVTGKSPGELHPRAMWPILAKTPDFYNNLGWLDGGRELWSFCLPYKPVILTGLPIGKWAEPQKRRWCTRELGEDIPVICCMSRDKALKAREYGGDVLIPVLVDDRLKQKEDWEAAGGVFILHTSAAESIAQLKALGFV